MGPGKTGPTYPVIFPGRGRASWTVSKITMTAMRDKTISSQRCLTPTLAAKFFRPAPASGRSFPIGVRTPRAIPPRLRVGYANGRTAISAGRCPRPWSSSIYIKTATGTALATSSASPVATRVTSLPRRHRRRRPEGTSTLRRRRPTRTRWRSAAAASMFAARAALPCCPCAATAAGGCARSLARRLCLRRRGSIAR